MANVTVTFVIVPVKPETFIVDGYSGGKPGFVPAVLLTLSAGAIGAGFVKTTDGDSGAIFSLLADRWASWFCASIRDDTNPKTAKPANRANNRTAPRLSAINDLSVLVMTVSTLL